MNAADPHCAMLSGMGACAYRLGKAFGEEAERAQTATDRIQYFQLFDRCFFAVRVGIALELRLKREAGRNAASFDLQDGESPTVRAERDPPEDERAEPLELEQPERLDYSEHDREREGERASFPLLLRTLQGVAADAEALPGPPPAALPTLRELLSRLSSEGVTAPTPGAGGGLRARLTGSAAAFAHPVPGGAATLSPPRPPGVGGRPRLRGATGPPPG